MHSDFRQKFICCLNVQDHLFYVILAEAEEIWVKHGLLQPRVKNCLYRLGLSTVSKLVRFCFVVFWLPVLLILVSEKPPWGVDNKICIVLYCIVGVDAICD